MSAYSTYENNGKYSEYLGNDGTNDDDICIETDDVTEFNTFMLSNAAGACKVEVNDGQNWLTAPLSFSDLGATDNNPVITTAALRQYAWRGFFKKLRVKQDGATAATGVVLRCARS